ncbi:MAG: glycosyltransferase family 4 protein [Deltaproteobacteria bacterium]|nr:glycosyltransferase family 4 protein [Deltaproteobacteria bacterium]
MKIWLPMIRGGSGADIFATRLAAALQRRGVTARISWFPTYFQFAPFLLSSIRPPSGTDIIHALSWSGFAFQRKDIPLVVTEQLDVFDPLYRPYKGVAQNIYHQSFIRTFVKASFRAAHAITAVSHATADSLRNILDSRKIHVIYNSVDTSVFYPHQRHRESNMPMRLLFVGNLTRRKGADLLAPIMKKLGPQFELRFTAGLRDRKLKASEPNMISIGRLIGDQMLLSAYHECDVLLFPSRLEGLPLAPLEAMACGKPVIAARASSLPEIVEHGVSGFLCESEAIDSFVSATQKLAAAPNTLRVTGDAARRRAESVFSEDVIVPQYIALYTKLLNA